MKIFAIYIYGNKISQLSSKKTLPNFSSIPIGFTSVLTNIKKNGHYVNSGIITKCTDINKFVVDNLFKTKYDMVCITSVTAHINTAKKTAKKIKDINKNIKIVIGGTHATLFADDIIKYKFFDAVCIGEGFQTIKVYLDYIQGKKESYEVNGFYIRENGKIIKNSFSEFTDFKKFPVIDRGIWDKHISDKNIHSVLVSRGCIHRCSFCVNHVFSKKNTGQYVGYRDIKDILKEIDEIKKKYKNTKDIILESETLTTNLPFTYKLLDSLTAYNGKLKNKLSFRINMSFNDLVKKDIRKFIYKVKKTNIICVNVGLESGSVRIRKEILKRPYYTNKDFISFCEALKKHDIKLIICVMIGIPSETVSDLEKTIDVVERIDPYSLNVSMFNLYPGTDICDFVMKKSGKNIRSAIDCGYDIKSYGTLKNKKHVLKNVFKQLNNSYGMQKKRERLSLIDKIARQ
ncbi:hypothetical protein MASR1M68_01590 [Elusimicrobiota bacterium]